MGGIINGALGNTNTFSANPGQTVSSRIEGYKPTSTQTGVSQMPTVGGAAQKANLQNPFTSQDVQAQQGQLQGTAAQQQNFINALGGQNGVGNQSSVFGQQQALANQLSDQAAGNGPNPAMAQLSEATSNNIKNQAALMAGQRGASHNAGMMAKQAADQGNAIQQQAAGQAATMRAQQQIAAQQQLQAQQASMANLSTQQVGQQAQGINALGNLQLGIQGQTTGMLAAQNQANLGMQENINNINAGRASQDASMQAQAIQQSNALNAQSQMANNQIGAGMVQQGNQIRASNAQATSGNNMQAQGINAQTAAGNSAQNAAVTGGILQAGGAALGAMAAHGGMIGYANGGNVMTTDMTKFSPTPTLPMQPVNSDPNGPLSSFGKKSASAQSNPYQSFGAGIGKALKGGMSGGQWFPSNGTDSSGPEDVQPLGLTHDPNFGTATGGSAGTGIMADNPTTMAKGGNVGSKLKTGGKVPGKAKTGGDSLKNDTVRARLSPGEIVIPRSITQGKDAPKRAAEFVASVLARGGR